MTKISAENINQRKVGSNINRKSAISKPKNQSIIERESSKAA